MCVIATGPAESSVAVILSIMTEYNHQFIHRCKLPLGRKFIAHRILRSICHVRSISRVSCMFFFQIKDHTFGSGFTVTKSRSNEWVPEKARVVLKF